MTDMIATPVKPSSASWYLANWLAPLKNLYVQVLVAVALGILLGVVYPGVAVDLKPLSDAFITLLRAVVPPIVFATVVISKWMGELDNERLRDVLDSSADVIDGEETAQAAAKA